MEVKKGFEILPGNRKEGEDKPPKESRQFVYPKMFGVVQINGVLNMQQIDIGILVTPIYLPNLESHKG